MAGNATNTPRRGFWSGFLVLLAIVTGTIGLFALPGAAAREPIAEPSGQAWQDAVGSRLKALEGVAVPAADDDAVNAASLGTEDRVRISPTSKPLATLVWIEVRDKDEDALGSCSGAIVGPGVVMTAAHCLFLDEDYYDEDEQPGSVRVVPGKNGFDEPWGSQVSTRWLVPAKYRSPNSLTDQMRYDFALIALPDHAMTDRTGVIPGGLAVLKDADFADQSLRFAAAGYPYDCDENACGPDSYGSLYGRGTYAWLAPTSFVWPDKDLLYHDADLYSGMSGSPLVRTTDLAVVGLVNGMGPFLERSVRLTDGVVSEMQQWCQQNGCALSLAAPSAAPNRPYRLVTSGVATDSAAATCGPARSFMDQFAATTSHWATVIIDFLELLIRDDFNPTSPSWKAEFDRRYAALAPATNAVIALTAPDARFNAYHREADAGLADYLAGLELLKRAIEINSSDDMDRGFDLMDNGDEHFYGARGLYPSIDPRCLASASTPFGPPPPVVVRTATPSATPTRTATRAATSTPTKTAVPTSTPTRTPTVTPSPTSQGPLADVRVDYVDTVGRNEMWLDYIFSVTNTGAGKADMTQYYIQSWLSTDSTLSKGVDKPAAGVVFDPKCSSVPCPARPEMILDPGESMNGDFAARIDDADLTVFRWLIVEVSSYSQAEVTFANNWAAVLIP